MTKQKALCVATRCTTPQQFIETFHRFCDEQSFFVATMNMRAVGLETPFSIQLADKSPVLRGLCVVLAAYTTAANPYKRPGIRLGIRRLTPDSEAVFYQLQAMRTATPQEIANEASEATEVPLSETPVPVKIPPIPTAPRVSPPATPPKRPTPTPRAGSVIKVPDKQPSAPHRAAAPAATDPHRAETKPAEGRAATTVDETRTPGSDFVLPANPLSTLTDKSIEGFVECTLYEETGNFFRADAADDFEPDEPVAPPPVVAPPVVEALPAFNPSSVIEHAFPEEPTSEPTRERHVAAPPILPLPPPPSAPVEPIENESSMKAAIKRVENSVAILMESLDARDTSRPIDETSSRGTPLPAGEAYARQVAKSRAKSRSKWLLLGLAGTAVALGAAILVVAMRSKAQEEVAPPSVKPPVVATTKPVVIEPPPVDKPVADVDTTDGDEVAAVTATDPSTPVVGEGPCRLEVKTTPAGTMVKVDDATLGPSPITIAGPCTKRKIELVHPRYKQEQRVVSLVADKPGSLDITLVRPTHTLTVTSNPSGATVYIAGRRAGTTPTKVPLMGFSGLEVKVEKQGFETVSKRVYSKVSQDKLSVTLKRSLFFKK